MSDFAELYYTEADLRYCCRLSWEIISRIVFTVIQFIWIIILLMSVLILSVYLLSEYVVRYQRTLIIISFQTMSNLIYLHNLHFPPIRPFCVTIRFI